MGKQGLNYTIKPSSVTSSFLKRCLKEDVLIKKRSDYEGFKFLAVFNKKIFLTAIPFKLFENNLTVGELFNIATRRLPLYPPTFSLDPSALTAALKRSQALSGKIIIHLPFLCPEFPMIYELTDPFIDMERFHKEAFVINRDWLARQQKKWSDFSFSFSEFDFSRGRDLVSFYFKNAIRRFKLSRIKVLHILEWFKQNSKRIHVAVLRDKTNIVAVHFLKIGQQRDLHIWYSAFNDELSEYAPGNALTFFLLCHIKAADIANRVFFGRIFPRTAPSYKLRWCDQSITTYLYHV